MFKASIVTLFFHPLFLFLGLWVTFHAKPKTIASVKPQKHARSLNCLAVCVNVSGATRCEGMRGEEKGRNEMGEEGKGRVKWGRKKKEVIRWDKKGM